MCASPKLNEGSTEIKKIRKKKEKHTWSVQVMEKLLELAEPDKYAEDGNSPMDSKFQNDEANGVTLPYNFVDNEVQFSHFIEEPKELEKPQDVEGSLLFCYLFCCFLDVSLIIYTTL